MREKAGMDKIGVRSWLYRHYD